MAITALALSMACGSASEESAFWSLGEGWPYADTLTYCADTAGTADLAVVVRHTANYEYSNLWLELSISQPGEEEAAIDTFNVILADDFGRWRGHGLGVGFQYEDTLLRNVHLQDSAMLRLRHIMRADTLNGIEQIGMVFVIK